MQFEIISFDDLELPVQISNCLSVQPVCHVCRVCLTFQVCFKLFESIYHFFQSKPEISREYLITSFQWWIFLHFIKGECPEHTEPNINVQPTGH